MSTSLIIHLADLPEEGLALSGELDGEIFDLREEDATSAGPLTYDLWAQRFEGELLLTGELSAPFHFTCVVTLKRFLQTIRVHGAAISIEIGNKAEIDLAEALREEVLIEFPIDPRCDEGDSPEPCEIDSRYLAVDKPTENGLSPAPRKEGDDRWSALDDITGLTDQP